MKICVSCKLEKPITGFNKHSSKKDGLQDACRDCSKKSSAKYYANNRDKHIATTITAHAKYRERNRKFLFDYLTTHPCVDCGNDDVRVLEFDHLRDKTLGVAKLVHLPASIKRIQAEIEKCEVRCRNCHQIATFNRMGGTWHDKWLVGLT